MVPKELWNYIVNFYIDKWSDVSILELTCKDLLILSRRYFHYRYLWYTDDNISSKKSYNFIETFTIFCKTITNKNVVYNLFKTTLGNYTVYINLEKIVCLTDMYVKYPLKIKKLIYKSTMYNSSELVLYKNIEYLCDLDKKIINHKLFPKLKKIVIKNSNIYLYKDYIDSVFIINGYRCSFNPMNRSAKIYGGCSYFLTQHKYNVKTVWINNASNENMISVFNSAQELIIHDDTNDPFDHFKCYHNFNHIKILRITKSKLNDLLFLKDKNNLEELYVETTGEILTYNGLENMNKLRIVKINGVTEFGEDIKCNKDRIIYTYNYYRKYLSQYDKFNPLGIYEEGITDYFKDLLFAFNTYASLKEILNKN